MKFLLWLCFLGNIWAAEPHPHEAEVRSVLEKALRILKSKEVGVKEIKVTRHLSGPGLSILTLQIIWSDSRNPGVLKIVTGRGKTEFIGAQALEKEVVSGVAQQLQLRTFFGDPSRIELEQKALIDQVLSMKEESEAALKDLEERRTTLEIIGRPDGSTFEVFEEQQRIAREYFHYLESKFKDQWELAKEWQLPPGNLTSDNFNEEIKRLRKARRGLKDLHFKLMREQLDLDDRLKGAKDEPSQQKIHSERVRLIEAGVILVQIETLYAKRIELIDLSETLKDRTDLEVVGNQARQVKYLLLALGQLEMALTHFEKKMDLLKIHAMSDNLDLALEVLAREGVILKSRARLLSAGPRVHLHLQNLVAAEGSARVTLVQADDLIQRHSDIEIKTARDAHALRLELSQLKSETSPRFKSLTEQIRILELLQADLLEVRLRMMKTTMRAK